ncbi:MAG: methylenetetrahydrofolate reductase [Thermoleophilaceae bacterium]|jgi:methylenetetrahydrofolate reductase (NADPH)|nr:methylenetetrahydrofolate reductase [Thermoleophilaceae bacterium]
MRIDEILDEGGPVFSFEFFPPQTDDGMTQLKSALSELSKDEPAYVSVTYGAGGSTRDRTVEVTKWIKQELGIEAMAHLSCVGEPVDRLREILDEVRDAGIENILALRGDPPRGESEWKAHPDGLGSSPELIELISESYDFCVGGACFPEVHPEAPSLEHDLIFCKRKVDAGASFLITQLFFDNELYFDFVREARAAGIEVPIIPGIIPVTNFAQIKRFTEMCGARIPDKFERELAARADDADAVKDLGVAYATLQCSALLARGAPGIHFYTLNRSPATRAILAALRAARPWDRRLEPV